MDFLRSKLLPWAVEIGGRDLGRPVELISLAFLGAWAQFLLSEPEVFLSPRYAAFDSLPPSAWAGIVMAVMAAQLLALRPTRWAPVVRFFGMSAAAGFWAVVAAAFWSSDTAPIAARIFTIFAFATFVNALYLGAVSRPR